MCPVEIAFRGTTSTLASPSFPPLLPLPEGLLNLPIKCDFLLLCQGIIFFLIHVLETFLLFLKCFPAFALCGGNRHRKARSHSPAWAAGSPSSLVLSLARCRRSVPIRDGSCSSLSSQSLLRFPSFTQIQNWSPSAVG